MFDMKNVTEVGIKFPKNITHEEHRAAGKALHTIEQGLQWAIGDWYNAIRWGDKEAECEDAGFTLKQCEQYGNVCAQYQIHERSGILGFVHHLRVAWVDEPLRSRLLRDAERNGWSERELVRQKQAALGIEPKPLLPAPAIDERVDALLESLPKSVSTKVKKDIKGVYEELKRSYQKDVQQGVREALKEQRKRIDALEKEAEENREAAIKLRRGVKAFITESDFRLVSGCLHPDKEPTPERRKKAFQIFQKLKPAALVAN